MATQPRPPRRPTCGSQLGLSPVMGQAGRKAEGRRSWRHPAQPAPRPRPHGDTVNRAGVSEDSAEWPTSWRPPRGPRKPAGVASFESAGFRRKQEKREGPGWVSAEVSPFFLFLDISSTQSPVAGQGRSQQTLALMALASAGGAGVQMPPAAGVLQTSSTGTPLTQSVINVQGGSCPIVVEAERG